MKYRMLDALVCPHCGASFRCTVFSTGVRANAGTLPRVMCTRHCALRNKALGPSCPVSAADCTACYGTEIEHGLLQCACGKWYPVVHGVPRILPANLLAVSLSNYPDYLQKFGAQLPEKVALVKVQDPTDKMKKETMRQFGYEWVTFSDYAADNFNEFIHPLKEEFFKGKTGLDVGCGAGRHVHRSSGFGMEMFGVDLSQAVDSAYENNKERAHVHILQGDVYHLPFRKDYFDFIYSLGVLHHLPAPLQGFQKVVPHLKPGGDILIWLYSWSVRKVVLEIARKITKKLSGRSLYWLALFGAVIDYGVFVNAYRLLSNMPLAGKAFEKMAPSRIRDYARYDFHVSHTDWYDRLSAPISNFYTGEQVRAWFDDTLFKSIEIDPVSDFWWRGFGTKK